MKRENNNYIIYKAQNIENEYVYIGTTTKSIVERKNDHEQKANTGHGHEFQEAISTYGADAFNWTQIDTASSTDELAQKEKEYIIQYDSKENGYNSDAGGGIQKTVYQYNIDGNLIAKYDCLKSAANAVSAYKTCVGNACIGQSKSCKGYYWSYSSTLPTSPKMLKDQRKKHVIQLYIDGRILAGYKSVAEASSKTGVNTTSIAKVCRGEYKTAGGYIWKYS